MAAIQAGADLKFTNNRKQNALAVAEACGFDLGVELLRKAKVDSKKETVSELGQLEGMLTLKL